MGAPVYSNPARGAPLDVNVFGPDPDADESRGNSAEPRRSIQEPHDEGRPHGRLTGEHATDDATLNEELNALRHASRKLPPALHVVKITEHHAPLTQREGETVGGSDRVLDRQIDAHTADGRHGMSGV